MTRSGSRKPLRAITVCCFVRAYFIRPASVLRWGARVLSLCSLGFVLSFAIGESALPGHLTGRDAILFLFFPSGLCLGLITAWWREKLGGGITVASVIGFYLIHCLLFRRLPAGPWFFILAVPGVLFCLCPKHSSAT